MRWSQRESVSVQILSICPIESPAKPKSDQEEHLSARMWFVKLDIPVDIQRHWPELRQLCWKICAECVGIDMLSPEYGVGGRGGKIGLSQGV